MDYLVASSMGNDSIATIQHLINKRLSFGVVYNNTGWAKDGWEVRVKTVTDILFAIGIPFFETKSEGMIALVKRKKGWPMPASAMQFCTGELKERPTLELLEKIDPDGELTIVTGRRRDESQNRSNLPEWVDSSEKHGGREVWNPLVRHDQSMRDELIKQFGLEPLPHSSMECYPCVCANKSDLAAMPKDDPRIDLIENAEIEMGFTRNSKPRTMFRPYRVGGGIGIRQAAAWGRGERGWKADFVPNEYKPAGENCVMFEGVSDIAYEDDTKEGRIFARQCDGGYCGS